MQAQTHAQTHAQTQNITQITCGAREGHQVHEHSVLARDFVFAPFNERSHDFGIACTRLNHLDLALRKSFDTV
jgi:hypothetical protein